MQKKNKKKIKQRHERLAGCGGVGCMLSFFFLCIFIGCDWIDGIFIATAAMSLSFLFTLWHIVHIPSSLLNARNDLPFMPWED